MDWEESENHKGTTVFWYRAMYRTGSVHGLGGIGDIKVRSCFCIGPGGTWIGPDTKTSTATGLGGHHTGITADMVKNFINHTHKYINEYIQKSEKLKNRGIKCVLT